MNPNLLSPEELKAAREWLADCVWLDVEPEEFASLPVRAIVRGIARHWDGGIEDFKRTVQSEVGA